MKILLSSIIVRDRQRKDLGNLSDLDSMAEANIGQIQPIGVNDKHELIWGMRRYSWAKAHGWTEIEAIVRTGLTPIDEQLIELYEDTKRKDRTWQERCIAAAKIHGMKILEAGSTGESWTTQELSAFTGIAHTTVKYLLALAKEINANPEGPVAKAENYFNALKVMMQQQKDRVTAELELRRQRGAAGSQVTLLPTRHEAEQYPIDIHWTELQKDGIAVTDEEAPFAEPGQDLTASLGGKPEPVNYLKLQGQQTDFTLTAFDQTYNLILAAFPEDLAILPKLRTVLSDSGYAVLWFRHTTTAEDWRMEAENAGLQVMPWGLVWEVTNDNLNYQWPFMPYATALVIHKGGVKQKVTAPASSVISARQEEPGTLPLEVVNFTVNALSLDGDAVVLPCNAPAVEVAICGRIPIFFEPDAGKFNALCDALAVHYETIIPNVQVIR